MFLCFILSISVGGIYHFGRRKSKNELRTSTQRFSEESQDSQDTLEDVCIE